MDVITQPALLLLTMLLLKHLVCDFLVQPYWMISGKARYGHIGGIVHAGFHSLASWFLVYLFTQDIQFTSWIVAGEFIIHYHMDWIKVKVTNHYKWTASDQMYWWMTGFDQWIHQMTYVAMVIVTFHKH